jgi:lysophospholipase L1-like esterase
MSAERSLHIFRIGLILAMAAGGFGCGEARTGEAAPPGGTQGGVAGSAGLVTGGAEAMGGAVGGGGASGGAGMGGSIAGSSPGGTSTGRAGATQGGAPGDSGSSAGGAAGSGAAGSAGFSGVGGFGGAGGAGNLGGSGGTGEVPIDPALLSSCTGSAPIRCALDVPNGNHTVTVELGAPDAGSSSRVQAELFRIAVPAADLGASAFARHTFTVNVRAERHDGYNAPGGILDLLIDGPMPRLRGLGVSTAPSSVTIFVAGDSTVCDWDPAATNISSADQRGWAQALSQYFLPGVAIANYADSGETAGGFYSKFWPGPAPLRAGDYVFVQFGHNDQKNATDIASYKANLRRYIADARSKGATPVVFTPVGRKSATLADPGFGGLDTQARELAAEDSVALVDLTTLSIQFFRAQANVNAYFAANGSDGTHLSEAGAIEVSRLVAEAIRASTLPLRSYVR